MTFPFAALPENLAAFCAMLRRDYGYRSGPRELQDALRALETVGLQDEHAVRNAIRPVLAGRLEEARLFDLAFDRFFRGGSGGPPPRDLPGIETARVPARSPSAAALTGRERDSASLEERRTPIDAGRTALRTPGERDEAEAAGVLRSAYSPAEAEGTALLLEPVGRDWREAAGVLVNRVHAGLSRRWKPAVRGQRFDFRRTLRSGLHTAGELVVPRYRARPRRQPRFVLLLDGSRSMEAHVRPALQMAVALAAVTLQVEAFAFSTSLGRITRDVRRAAAGDRQLLRPGGAWGGGTTIGACVREFLRRYGERVLNRDTVVIIASDGLDVGDLLILRDAMARLSRLSAAIVWINPLLDTPGYEPTAGGMRVARPFVSVMAVVRDPESLVRLARRLRLRGRS